MKLLRVAKKFMFYDCFSFYSFTTPATATHPSQSSMPLHRIPNFVSLCDCDSKVKKKESIFIAPVKRRERKLFPIFMRPGFDFLCFQASAFYILIIFLFWNFLMDYKYRNIIFKGEMYNNKILLHNSTFFHFLLPLVFNLINFISYFFPIIKRPCRLVEKRMAIVRGSEGGGEWQNSDIMQHIDWQSSS